MKTSGAVVAGCLGVMALRAAVPGERFATALIEGWCGGTENVCFSPFSLSAALAMTAAGARGDTASQIAGALDLAPDAARLPEAFQALDTQLTAARRDSPGLRFAVANGLFPQQRFALRPDFLATIRDRFGGEATPLDYAQNPEAARQTINGWVEAQTGNRIRNLIAPGVLTPLTRLTLVNAIYFKGAWATPFDPTLTQPAPFFNAGDSQTPVPLMQRRGRMDYAEQAGVQAVALPYAGGRFAMLVLLPPAGHPVSDVVKRLRTGGCQEWVERLAATDVSLFLPRFTCTWQRECSRTLSDLGMVNLFDASRADLSGIAGEPGDLVVSAVVHKAFVEVAEAGTEAAAATGVIMRTTAARPSERHVIFRADRPFIWLIREQASGCILFAGVVARGEF